MDDDLASSEPPFIRGEQLWLRDLPPLPQSVREARAFVGTALSNAGHDDLVDDAEQAISEVVTNAVVHAGTAIDVIIWLDSSRVRVGVRDRSARLPRTRDYAVTAGTGRGLRLLDQVTSDWGADAEVEGKMVWFDLGPASTVGRQESGLPRDQEVLDPAALSTGLHPDRTGSLKTGADSEPDCSDLRELRHGSRLVRLLDAPVLLYSAWRQHAETLLREYFLFQLDRGLDEEAVQVHADASAALAFLDDHLPTAPSWETPDQALAAAAALEATSPSVQMDVTASARQHFITLDDALTDAVRLAEDDRLLAPPAQPELRRLRHWICNQVEAQCAGGDPQAWEPLDTIAAQNLPEPLTWSLRVLAWDASVVTDSSRALVAVNDTSTIIAVSQSAVSLLGYGTADELLGRRLIAVIPDRFRQAHLAGFTFHLLTGDGALLDATVTVPVLRRDRSEAMVHLTVREQQSENGRPVFVADLVEASDAVGAGG